MVDQHLLPRMSLDVLKQKRRPARFIFFWLWTRFPEEDPIPEVPIFDNTVGDSPFRDPDQIISADTLQLALLFECLNPFAQILVGHFGATRAAVAAITLIA